MKDRMERFVVLPFAVGCGSQNSVAVTTTTTSNSRSSSSQTKQLKPETKTSTTRRQGGGEENDPKEKMKMHGIFGNFLALPRQNISNGIHKLMRSIKSLSQVFVYKEENDDEEREMEIGYPTDVKHVTHIGLDGTTTTTSNTNNNNHATVKGCWENLKPPELFSFPSLSLRQFELAMAAQSHHAPVIPAIDPS